MDSNVRNIQSARARQRTYYERFMEKEGVPVVEGFGVTDVRNLPLKTWKRLGCDGAYLQLRGLEGITGVYVGKLAPGATSPPERHLVREGDLHSARPRRGGDSTARPSAAFDFMANRQPVFAADECAASTDEPGQRAGVVSRRHHRADGARSLSQRSCLFLTANLLLTIATMAKPATSIPVSNVISRRTIANGFGRLTLFPMRGWPNSTLKNRRAPGSISPSLRLPTIS